MLRLDNEKRLVAIKRLMLTQSPLEERLAKVESLLRASSPPLKEEALKLALATEKRLAIAVEALLSPNTRETLLTPNKPTK